MTAFALERFHTKPGHICLFNEPRNVCAMVGHGLTVTLHDRRRGVGGLSHFLYTRQLPNEMATGKFAQPALDTLVKMFVDDGSDVNDLEAQVFGGAQVAGALRGGADTSESLVQTGMMIMRSKGIRVITMDVGGRHWRKLVFNTQTSETVVGHVN